MAASSIPPKKFDSGDVVTRFHQFDCCATANNWNEEKGSDVKPAFLHGPTPTYFHALPNATKDSYQRLRKSLQAVDLERNFADLFSTGI